MYGRLRLYFFGVATIRHGGVL